MSPFAALAALALFLVASVHASVYVTSPTQSSACAGGESCPVRWIDNGQTPLLSALGVCDVALYTGNFQLAQMLPPVNVAAETSFEFVVDASAGSNGQYYLVFSSTTLNYRGFSASFALTGMTGTTPSGGSSAHTSTPTTTPTGSSASAGATTSGTSTDTTTGSAPSGTTSATDTGTTTPTGTTTAVDTSATTPSPTLTTPTVVTTPTATATPTTLTTPTTTGTTVKASTTTPTSASASASATSAARRVGSSTSLVGLAALVVGALAF